MNNVIVWAGVLGSVLGIATSIVALLALYKSSIRKGYAAERDFNHLQRNFEALSQNIEFMVKNTDSEIGKLAKEVDTRCDRIDLNQNEIKALVLANLGINQPKSTE